MGMGIHKNAAAIARIIQKQDEIQIITHCDADGLTGAAIAKQALDILGIKHTIKIVSYLTQNIIKDMDTFTWFIDLGNGYANNIEKNNFVMTDHHFSSEYHNQSLNPFHFGVDGETEISAAGLTYLIASNFGYEDSSLAIVGAIGDLQDHRYCKLIGFNRQFLEKSNIKIRKDIRCYGRKKPLFRMIAYASNPFIPGLFKKSRNAIGFLKTLDIDYNKSWMDCTRADKKKILSSLIKILIEKGFSYDYISKIFGEVYELYSEDVRWYATLLNSLGKYGQGETAIIQCINGKFNGEMMIAKHRQRICKYISYAKKNLDEYDEIYYFHGGTYILDTVIGSIAGMLLRDENISCPVLAFAENDEGIKVSARAPSVLIEEGLNLSLAIKHSAKLLGGDGGGHKVAAGATIPKGNEEKFLELFNTEIRNQLTR